MPKADPNSGAVAVRISVFDSGVVSSVTPWLIYDPARTYSWPHALGTQSRIAQCGFGTVLKRAPLVKKLSRSRIPYSEAAL
jgi:hypothetical protein